MKSIKAKILVMAMSLMLASILIIGTISVLSTYLSTMFALEESMMSTIDATADMIEVQLTAYKDMANQFAVDPILTQEIPEVGEEADDGRTRQQVINEISARFTELGAIHNFESVQIIQNDGTPLTSEGNFSSVELFTVPRDTGMAHISDPLVSPETGQLTMAVTAPIIRNGSFDGVVLFAVNPTVFSEIASKVAVGEGSTTTIIDSKGNTIAYNDVQLVFDAFNTIEEAKSDPALADLAILEQNLIDGKEGFMDVSWDGVAQFAAYTAIDNSNGWGIYVLTHQDNFLAQMITSIVFIIILSIVIIIIAVIIVSKVSTDISKPIKLCVERLNLVTQGDINSPMPDVKSNDETGVLANSTGQILHSISTMINDISDTLSEVASGNFAAQSKAKEYYVGDFAAIKESMETIVSKLSSTMQQISDVSNQVSTGNTQVAFGAQSLAQGAIEQASAVEELSATILEISNKTQESSEASQAAKTLNGKAHDALEQSTAQMREMVEAMRNINDKSIQMSNIIKAIDDIAFQTNILSLNAAVEAARAGSAGRSFAVVADEVRNLATKSAQSAQDTAVLIEETVEAVNKGNKIATETSESISIAMDSANELGILVDNIAEAGEAQASGTKQISIGIDQISAVVQTNSATAEESAATSEELSSQSQILKDLLSEFTLSENDDVYKNQY